MKTQLLFLPFTKNKINRKTLSFCDTEQAQRLGEIGEQLRQTREQHSLSFDMVATYTRIRVHLLQALEEGRLDQLPEPVYTQGLIRRYGDALGLNGEELANFFLPEPVEQSVESKLGFLSLPQLRPTHLYLTYILLIICAINGLSYLNGKGNFASLSQDELTPSQLPEGTPPLKPAVEQPPAPKSQFVSHSTNTPTPSSVAVEKKAEPTPSPTPSDVDKTVEVGLMVKDESWVLIEIDGKTEFEGILPGGTERKLKANQELVIVAGNAGGVLVTVNNGQTKQLGEPGMVKELVLKADNTSPTEEVQAEDM